MITGHGVRAEASDGVEAIWTNDVWKDDVENVFVSDGLLKCKIQVEGSSNYVFDGKVEDDVTGPTVAFLYHPSGAIKREFTRKGTRERSLTLLIPTSDDKLGGCSREDSVVDRVAAELCDRLVLKQYRVPKAAYSCINAFF